MPGETYFHKISLASANLLQLESTCVSFAGASRSRQQRLLRLLQLLSGSKEPVRALEVHGGHTVEGILLKDHGVLQKLESTHSSMSSNGTEKDFKNPR